MLPALQTSKQILLFLSPAFLRYEWVHAGTKQPTFEEGGEGTSTLTPQNPFLHEFQFVSWDATFFLLSLPLVFRPWAIRPRNNFWAVHTWWVKCWGMKCFFFSCVKFYAIETNWFWNYECRVAYFAGKKWLAFLSWCKIIQALCQERDDSWVIF